MEHIITGMLQNRPGVLSKVVDRFTEMQINIDSLAVAPTEDAELSRVTIVISGHDVEVDRLAKELTNLVEVHALNELGLGDHYERELALVQVRNAPEAIGQIMQLAELFDARTTGVSGQSLTLQVVGEPEQIDGFIRMLRPFNILGVARTGRTAIKKDVAS